MGVKFKFEKFRDFDVMGVKIRPFPLTLHLGLNIVQCYRTACERLVFGNELSLSVLMAIFQVNLG